MFADSSAPLVVALGGACYIHPMVEPMVDEPEMVLFRREGFSLLKTQKEDALVAFIRVSVLNMMKALRQGRNLSTPQ